jgi:hypothetical protein
MTNVSRLDKSPPVEFQVLVLLLAHPPTVNDPEFVKFEV